MCLESIWSRRVLRLYRYFFDRIGHWGRSKCFIFTIFSFLLDVLSFGIWPDAASLTDSSLSDMIPGPNDLQLEAKAPSTVLKYKSGWLR